MYLIYLFVCVKLEDLNEYAAVVPLLSGERVFCFSKCDHISFGERVSCVPTMVGDCNLFSFSVVKKCDECPFFDAESADFFSG